MAELLKRYSDRPVLEPRGGKWDAVSTFNPGAIVIDGKVHMLYRAVTDLRPYVSRFGYAVADDGYTFTRVHDAFVHEPTQTWDVGGVEDARITPDPDGEGYLVTYAAPIQVPGPGYEKFGFWDKVKADPFTARPGGDIMGPSYTGLMHTPDFHSFTVRGFITPEGTDDRDGILFPEKINGRHVLLHRPSAWKGPGYGTDKASMWIAFSDDLKTWDYGQGDQYLLMKPREGVAWEEAKIGGSAPPIRTDAGWFILYHGVDHKHVYRVGAALLDLENPLKVVARTDNFLMQPELPWEIEGVIPNVVFPTANVIHDGLLKVYYGGADKVTGCATGKLDELLDHLLG